VRLADISGTKKNLKAKIEELETNSKINNIWDMYRGISDFRPNIVKDEKGDLISLPHYFG
jgi:hypothetical protein